MNSEQESAIAEFLQILEDHRKNCELQGKYVEAEIAKNRLDELKMHEENRRSEAMKARQIAERLGVEEAHMLEFQQFNNSWDKKMSDYESHAQAQIKTMSEKHGKSLQEFQSKLLEKQKQKPKFSTELLSLRKIQEHLAKAKDYGEAHKMKVKADGLEGHEISKWQRRKQKEMTQQESKFKSSQEQELGALKKRLTSGRASQKKQRGLELERLLQRYQNVKNELEAHQNLERTRNRKGSYQAPLPKNGTIVANKQNKKKASVNKKQSR